MGSCYDRRCPEWSRVTARHGAEFILVACNTPLHDPARPAFDRLAEFHNLLCLQSGAYSNGAWIVGVAKAGCEAGVEQIGQSCIIAPSGEVMAMASTVADELITFECDLDDTRLYKDYTVNRGNTRRPELYAPIAAQASPVPSG